MLPEQQNDLPEVINRISTYIQNASARNTLRAYRSDWSMFVKWCTANGRSALPADEETIVFYISTLAGEGKRISTIQRRLTSISLAHQTAGQPSPALGATVRTVWRGIRKTHGVAVKGKDPIRIEDLKDMVRNLPDSMMGYRDRAILLLGFAGAFRRSELVGLNVEDATFVREGLVAFVRRSKTDQEGQGRRVGIPFGSQPGTCPVRAVEKWLSESGIPGGPLFRKVTRSGSVQNTRLCDRAVALIVKRAAENVGLDASRYAGHSLRSGLATSAAAAGASERVIMAQTGHKSVEMVRRYIREGNLFRENAAAFIGL
jgi:site-specific recombinase XerD